MESNPIGRTLIYERVSSWGQTGNDHVSLDVQDAECRGWIERHGGTLKYVLRDEAKSGRDADRPEYLRMLALVAAGEVDTVVVWALDRIGRDTYEYLRLMREFERYGVTLKSATQDLENRMLATFLMIVGEEVSNKISANVLPAQRARLDAGKWVGRAPLGYKLAAHPTGGKRLVVDQDTGWKVTELFELYATGTYGLARLALEAKRLGLGNGQSKTNLSRMLSNMTYVGKLVWGRRKKQRGADGKRHLNMQRPENWIVRDGDHDALVDQDVFDAVQAVLAKNQTAKSPRAPQRQLLVGVIYCKCGSRMQGVVGGTTARSGKTAYYYCRDKRERRTSCDQPFVACWKLDDLVKARIEAVMAPFMGETRDAALAALRDDGDVFYDQNQKRRRDLEAMAQRVTGARIVNGEAFDRGVKPEDLYRAQEEAYASQLRGIMSELADCEVQALPSFDAFLAVTGAMESFDDYTADEWRELVATTVARVDVDGTTASVKMLDTVPVRQTVAAPVDN